MRIITAWQCFSPEVKVKSSMKCCISNAVDGTNNILWNDSEVDGNAMSECKEGEGTGCEEE
jgi:hypothetical protein